MASIIGVQELQHTNGTSAMTIDGSGQTTFSQLPFIRMEVSGSPSTTIGSNSIGIVPYNNVLASQGITHNTSTFAFQVPVAGLYNFQGGLRWNNASNYLWWRVAQTDGTVLQGFLMISTGNGSGFITSFGSILLPLEASTDYRFEFGDGSANFTTNVQGGQSFMCIHSIGATQ
jgi:hypothetical protein